MAKKSISDIVLRAVVDTSGVASGLNNIGAQVSGRSFGQSGGGPTGASGAAGGFVNPHGGGAGPGVAATAAAAAAGAAVARAGGGFGGGRPFGAAPDGARFRSATESMRNMWGRAGHAATLREHLARRPMSRAARFYAGMYEASGEDYLTGFNNYPSTRRRFGVGLAADIGILMADEGYRSFRAAQRGASSVAGAARRGLIGAGNRIGDFVEGAAKYSGLLGMGRFAPLGGAAIAGGSPFALAAGIHGAYRDRYSSATTDLTRFNFGEDRAAAMRSRAYWKTPGQKAPLGLSDRFQLGAYKQGGVPWWEKALKASGEYFGNAAEQGGAEASQMFSTLLTGIGLIRTFSPVYRIGEGMVTAIRRAMN